MTEGVLGRQTFDAQVFKSLMKTLCFLVTLAVFSIVFASTDTAFLGLFFPRELAELRIFCVAFMGHPIQVTSCFILSYPITEPLLCTLSGDFFFIYGLLAKPWEVAQFYYLRYIPFQVMYRVTATKS